MLELGPKAEGEDPDVIRASIRHMVRGAEVFIPASVTKMGDDKVVQYLVEGYAFIRRDHPDQAYYRLENSKFVQAILKQPHIRGSRQPRQIAYVTADHIERFRTQIRIEVDQGISVGDLVLITSGAYRQITARVENEILEHDAVQVHIKLRSKEAIITLPRACLRLVQKAPRSPFLDRTVALRGWFQGAEALFFWRTEDVKQLLFARDSFDRLNAWVQRGKARISLLQAVSVRLDPEPLLHGHAHFERLRTWMSRARPLYATLKGIATTVDTSSLRAKAQEWERLNRWSEGGKRLLSFVSPSYTPRPTLESKYLEWLWFQDVFSRLDTVQADLDAIDHALQEGPQMNESVENIVVDGLQLAIRCLLAPGLCDLTDAQGRPTGAIVGFLKSLVSFRKRFPGATIYVTWDGSSQRRKALFADYKANRSAKIPVSFEVEWLREVLPLLGVHQAFHPEEEADDAIATLLKGPLKGQRNVFISTDRDLLQLVTATDYQFVPAVGMGKEKTYDVNAVLLEYGVPPSEVVFVRALSGDTSDNIPGAPGFGPKTASKLVKLYGSVERVLSSNLAGLTKTQYVSLRGAEAQVRLNVVLMGLHSDLQLTHVDPNPDQITVQQRLQDVDIKPDSIVSSFFDTVG